MKLFIQQALDGHDISNGATPESCVHRYQALYGDKDCKWRRANEAETAAYRAEMARLEALALKPRINPFR